MIAGMDEALAYWPLVVVVLDGYDPWAAPLVLDVIADTDDLTINALWACHGMAAEEDCRLRIN